MKTKSLLNFCAVALILIVALCGHPFVAAFSGLGFAASFLAPEARLGTPTLILPILTGKVLKAFRPKVPAIDFVSTDFGKPDASGFVLPVKFGQPVISQLASIPTVSRYQPNAPFSTSASAGLGSNAQSATGLVSDLTVLINRGAKATIRLPAGDIMQLLAMPAFLASLDEAAAALGRFMVNDGINEALSGRNFSYSLTAPSPDLDSVDDARVDLNNQLAEMPRFGLASTSFMSALAADPRVLSQFGYGQKIGANPWASFVNMKGFDTVQEMNQFPQGNGALGTFTADYTTADGTYTLASLASGVDPVINFYNGARVQMTSSGGSDDLPTGIVADTNYFIINYTPAAGAAGQIGGSGVGGTFQLSATLGGANANISGNGTGTLTLTQNENLEAIFFEKRAIHIASRPMLDPFQAARDLGIPTPILTSQETDDESKVSITAFMWQDSNGTNPTGDIFVSFVIQFGVLAGKSIALPGGTGDPTTLAQNAGMDRCLTRAITA